MSGALQGIRVVDFGQYLAGPLLAMLCADQGADVVRIDPPGGPRWKSQANAVLQRGKRSIVLDLKRDEDRETARALVQGADVVIENFRPDVKQRLGIDYESLKALNPRLVYASISGFGETGPYRERPGFDQIAQGMGGLMSITGAPGQGPMRVGIPVADLSSGLFCALGVLVALLEREQSGIGQWVQTSLLQAQIFMLDFQAARFLMRGDVARQAGNNHPTSIPTGVFKTADGHINIASTGQKIWERLCRAIGAEDLLAHPDYNTAAKRSTHRDALNAEIDRRLAGRGSREWIDIFNTVGVPCGPINSIDKVFADPQVAHLGIVQRLANGKRGDNALTVIGQPVTLSRTPSAIVAPPPQLGEHNDEVLAEFGFTPGEIDDLRRAKAI